MNRNKRRSAFYGRASLQLLSGKRGGAGNVNQIGIGNKGLEVVEDQDFVISFLLDGGIQTVFEIAEIHDPDLGIILCQVGDKTVGIAVLYDQNAPGAVPFDDGIMR